MSFRFSPADIVLSCTICQKTLSAIYADEDPIKGLYKDGDGFNDGNITKLWLTECAHLTCGSHLLDGGAPFHTIHKVPRAPCPLCSLEKNDHSDKALFFVNGISKGDYDENIPDAYFQMPPIQLSGGDPGLEALRFQYLSLLRFGTKTQEKLMGLTKALARWEDKKPEIVRSLSNVTPLRDELLIAGRRLMASGEDVSSIDTTLKLAGVNLTEGLQTQQQSNACSEYHKPDFKITRQKSFHLNGGSRLALGSAADLDSLNHSTKVFKGLENISHQDSTRQEDPSMKRKWEDSRSEAEYQSQYTAGSGGSENCRSRDQMPPPPIRMPQSFVYKAKVPSSALYSLDSPQNHVNGTHILQSSLTPHQHASDGGLSRTALAPGSLSAPSNISLAGAGTNNERSCIDHSQSPRANTGTAGPICARGGWQPPANSFDTVSSGYYSSPSSSLLSRGQPPVRRSAGNHQGSLMCPIDLGDRTIDPSSRSFQSIYHDGSSSYRKIQSALAIQSQPESPALLCYHKSSPNREGRITLSRTPSFATQHLSKKGVGLSSHIRSSSRHTNNPLNNSNSHRQQLKIVTPAHQRVPASPHFSTRQQSYRDCRPPMDGSRTQIFCRSNSFNFGPTAVNGETRPYFSTDSESLLRAQISHAAQVRGSAPFMEPQVPGPRRRADR